MTPHRVVVFGSTGFVGHAVCAALLRRGVEVVSLDAPRLRPTLPSGIDQLVLRQDVRDIASACDGAKAVVNAAGIADAGSGDRDALAAVNGGLPGVLGRVCVEAGVPRLIQVSSAAVQGRVEKLDARPAEGGFSAYSWSKCVGEWNVERHGPPESVVFRPPGVHGVDRSVTRAMTRLAGSPLSSVAAPGTQGTPQALIENVADAIAFLALTEETPPAIVHYPSEGLTTHSLLQLLGEREPLIIPYWFAAAVIKVVTTTSHVVPKLRAVARRLEILWLGQGQQRSWLTAHGWTPRTGPEGWASLGMRIRREQS